ncbi:hypothetical protein Salat_2770600 [Sesamum alatum]|uniref:Uncharacterized protein n=1 Tax=Sesamum alatum TaxID=300844 RepID=A0AAE1XLH2_9LAMI|nr:hypothetical protein Salat_2770600 [Sesamum alatum]
MPQPSVLRPHTGTRRSVHALAAPGRNHRDRQKTRKDEKASRMRRFMRIEKGVERTQKQKEIIRAARAAAQGRRRSGPRSESWIPAHKMLRNCPLPSAAPNTSRAAYRAGDAQRTSRVKAAGDEDCRPKRRDEGRGKQKRTLRRLLLPPLWAATHDATTSPGLSIGVPPNPSYFQAASLFPCRRS